MLGAKPNFLYLPIETWVREFHAKTLLAVHAVNQGWSVVIGPKTSMDRRLHRLPQGTVFQFGLHKNFATNIRQLKALGHRVVAVDEEGLVTLSPTHYLRYKVSEDAIAACDACFCWGPNQYSMLYEAVSGTNCSLEKTGNPRLDLLRPEFRVAAEKEAAELRARHGKFVLLNGNFGSFNHFMGFDYLWKSLGQKGWLNEPADVDFHRRRIGLQGRIFNALREVVPKLASAGHSIIIRPHPSENLEPWLKIAQDSAERVKVIREGNIVPWLLAANALLHNGCTTSVEAFVLGRPVVSFRPAQDLEVESELPNRISMQAFDEAELLGILKEPELMDARTRDIRAEYALNHVSSMAGATSSSMMVSALPRVDATAASRTEGGIGSIIDAWYAGARAGLSKLLGRNESTTYVAHKCGSLDIEVLRATVLDYAEAMKMTSIPRTREIGNGLIRLDPG